jgi:hypothetical protein
VVAHVFLNLRREVQEEDGFVEREGSPLDDLLEVAVVVPSAPENFVGQESSVAHRVPDLDR